MAETLKVQIRKDLGKRRSRRLRQAGATPATLYGHGQEPVNLTVSSTEVTSAGSEHHCRNAD